MKVNQVLTESVTTVLENGIDFNDLTSRHIGTLRAISQNRVDINDVSERMEEMIETLVTMGFITSELSLTPSGEQVIQLADVLGGSKERRRAATKDDVKINDDDVYLDDYASPDDDLDGFDSIYQPNRFGSINQMN